VLDVLVIDDPKAAAAALDPLRARLLAELVEPASAGSLAGRVDLPRQKLNYHLKALEQVGLVHQVAERKHGGITERVVQATAATFVISAEALGASGADPARVADEHSAAHLIALAARTVQEVGLLDRLAADAQRRLPTLSLDAEIGFASAEDRAAFAEELTAAVADLVARYHHDDGRRHRLVVGSHPCLDRSPNPSKEHP
jgi:DNA-binding transcriptional ArsR family regulator